MELWIRSQNRESLVLVKSIWLEDTSSVVYTDDYTLWCNSGGDGSQLGSYATEERALEVLDDIEQLLMFTQGTGFSDFDGNALYNVNNNLAVYEMPKE